MLKLGLASMVAVFAAFTTLPACDSVEHAYDCNQICGRYQECFDDGYDTGDCESRCRSHASDDDTYGNQAEDCQSCIGDKSCTGAAFGCATECAGIVP